MNKYEEKYLSSLMKQFSRATGIEDFSKEDSFIKFQIWLENMYKLGAEYGKLLDNHNINFIDDTVAEVGKSGWDSVVIPYNTKIITEVPSTFKFVDKERLLEGKIEVEPDGLYIMPRGKKRIKNDCINTVMTQNPDYRKQNSYGSRTIERLAFLHNNELNKIIIGFFGSLKDKDIKEKKEALKFLKKSLEELTYTEIAKEKNNNYYYAIVTDPTAKKKRTLWQGDINFYPFIDKNNPSEVHLDTIKDPSTIGVRVSGKSKSR